MVDSGGAGRAGASNRSQAGSEPIPVRRSTDLDEKKARVSLSCRPSRASSRGARQWDGRSPPSGAPGPAGRSGEAASCRAAGATGRGGGPASSRPGRSGRRGRRSRSQDAVPGRGRVRRWASQRRPPAERRPPPARIGRWSPGWSERAFGSARASSARMGPFLGPRSLARSWARVTRPPRRAQSRAMSASSSDVQRMKVRMAVSWSANGEPSGSMGVSAFLWMVTRPMPSTGCWS